MPDHTYHRVQQEEANRENATRDSSSPASPTGPPGSSAANANGENASGADPSSENASIFHRLRELYQASTQPNPTDNLTPMDHIVVNESFIQCIFYILGLILWSGFYVVGGIFHLFIALLSPLPLCRCSCGMINFSLGILILYGKYLLMSTTSSEDSPLQNLQNAKNLFVNHTVEFNDAIIDNPQKEDSIVQDMHSGVTPFEWRWQGEKMEVLQWDLAGERLAGSNVETGDNLMCGGETATEGVRTYQCGVSSPLFLSQGKILIKLMVELSNYDADKKVTSIFDLLYSSTSLWPDTPLRTTTNDANEFINSHQDLEQYFRQLIKKSALHSLYQNLDTPIKNSDKNNIEKNKTSNFVGITCSRDGIKLKGTIIPFSEFHQKNNKIILSTVFDVPLSPLSSPLPSSSPASSSPPSSPLPHPFQAFLQNYHASLNLCSLFLFYKNPVRIQKIDLVISPL